jgi:hypothetical protein
MFGSAGISRQIRLRVSVDPSADQLITYGTEPAVRRLGSVEGPLTEGRASATNKFEPRERCRIFR